MRKYCNHCGMEVDFTEYKGEQFAELRGNSHAELWGNSHAELWGNSHAELRGNSHAELWGNSHAELWGNSHAELRENSHAVLWENSHAVLWENSHAVLRGNSHAELRENSHAVLWENSHAVLRGNSHAELRENSHAVLRGNSHAVLWGNSHAQCKSPYACGILKFIASSCTGRHIGDKPIKPEEYLQSCGIEIKRKAVILYKSVTKDFTDHKTGQIKYLIGKEVVCPDWDADFKGECGYGLHLSPTIQQAISFNDSGTYLACRVKVANISSLPAFAEYPDKIRVKTCKPLYQVDKEGNKLSKKEVVKS
jgi:hypothetical protein